MADYAVGDVQGCFGPLQNLLTEIAFSPVNDRLWFVGDLVNRGPDSLAVLRFVKSLGERARVTLGNHDLHLLARLFVPGTASAHGDTLDEVLAAPDALSLGHWLRAQPLLWQDSALGVVMTHAGIPPWWDVETASRCAREVEQVLIGDRFVDFLAHMYGNKPDRWSESLEGIARYRLIVNALTRMRFCHTDGTLSMRYKGTVAAAPSDIKPWFAISPRKALNARLVFGHWAALEGECPVPDIYAVDTGCVWGGSLTALRLQDNKRFSVPGYARARQK
ncbi:bis(5'-nucleosyl)-tetraphosphatase [Legionella geestiana]|uniref:Bis(5'-nucleosyl)-tetraphosphatase, symmetrical n=1 Tax=Legionella geestiana TaxID=45065 RepID=A0A0W0U937_9GAMM|nr:symmetrical bis(5'-nucleosyl)-tetraphosphatase [Legionella geestiana]KTD04488.1 bis(5'-nucleosyl)-tetraphosphatase [Legionella geestiana]QBS12258.1 symmetrical bis(5'-nucleosyl)-tetraphosphatase [Legionella geestiana]QDQ40030.1 symmetrical bis(5'-nucleosyl)-tetraphosphatase [Legionella geestiana]STX53008.1 bis(5'-nucleosyl)-tetraphosphatase [Legionella geestiana]